MSFKDKFNYDPNHHLDIRVVQSGLENGVEIKNLTYATPFGYRRAAYLLSPVITKPSAAILFAHWLETWDPTANRTQFLEEAKQLSTKGAVCLLVETMWSDQDWFIKRSHTADLQNSIQQVIELRVAADLLLSQPDVDPGRFGYVGHDFGGMFGVLTGSIDQRASCYVIMASTPRFSDWYLYYPPITEPARREYLEEFAPLDPINHIADLSPSPIMFQFADDDFHVPTERADEFFAAAQQPKEIHWYQAKHGLNKAAADERLNWLCEQLGLS